MAERHDKHTGDSSGSLAAASESLRDKAKTLFQYHMRRLTLPEFVMAAILIITGVLMRTVHIVFREMFGNEFRTLDYLEGKIGAIDVFSGVMPLYYWIIDAWASCVGTSNDLLLRLPSVIFGLATLLCIFIFAQRFLRGIAFISALLVFCLNPILIAASNQATPFALLGLIATLSCYFTVIALNKGGLRNWIGMAVTAVLGFLTHPIFMFLTLGQMIFVAFRPARPPRAMWITSIITGAIILSAMIFFAILGQEHFKIIESNIPALDDVTYSLVAVICGDFDRYWNTEFIRAFLYMAVFAMLIISFYYYWQRQVEDNALPDGVIWIDDTADIVQNWRRLSLATFMRLHWITFAVPVFGIFIIASCIKGIDLTPEQFIICLPPFAILFASGVDYAPGRYTKYILTCFFAATMIVYGINTVADNGYGVEKLSHKLNDLSFDSTKDKLIVAYYRDNIKPSFDRYGINKVQFIPLDKNAEQREINTIVEQAVGNVERAFVFYVDDFTKKHVGGETSNMSFVRVWFNYHQNLFPTAKSWRLSRPEKAELVVYTHENSTDENTTTEQTK